jgi:lysophospholipase L1-like esterase
VGPPVNSLGFLGPEPLEAVPAGAVRLVVLGDSCSQQGWPESYPDLLAAELSARGVAVDLVNLSMSGYSTHQGRVLAETELPGLAPALVLVWYGWNDHWQAYGAPDAEKRGSLRRERLYRASRLLQGLRRLSGRAGLKTGAPRLELARVPLDDYRANLTAIVRAARAAGAEAVLVTAPSSHRRLGVPAYLVDEGFAPSTEAVVERHLEYARATREVAAAEDAPLADLDAELERAIDPARAFVADGIHLSVPGRRAVALWLADFLEERALVARRP